MPAMKMTDAWVKSGKACAIDGKRTNWTDTKTTGLVLRVSAPSRKFPNGLKTWSLSYRRLSDGKKRFYTMGKYSEHGLTLSKARQVAGELMAAIANGADPAGEKQHQKQTDTFEELALLWIEKYSKKNKNTWKEDLRYLEADAFPVFGNMKAHKIETREIAKFLEKKAEKAPVAANRLHSVLHKLFAWAIATGRLEGVRINPAGGIPKNPEQNRTSFLKTDEAIKIFWEAIGNSKISDQTRDILKISLLTGQRSGEPRRTKQADVNLDAKTWTIRREIAKTKKTDRNAKDHILPMTPEVYRIFKATMERAGDSEYVFPSPVVAGKPLKKGTLSTAWRRIREKIGLEDVNVHDLRRTLRTGLGNMGISSETKDRITNHGKKRDASSGDRFYDGGRYLPEMRAALEAWENHVMAIVEGREADKTNVVALRGGKEPQDVTLSLQAQCLP